MRPLLAILPLVIALTAFAACDKATPVAPAESGLTISANPTKIDVDGQATITVIARKLDGTPVNGGTEVNFSTTFGLIDELVATNDRGVASAVLRGLGGVGMATVTASSGAAAPVTVDVQIGSLAGSITVKVNPKRIRKDIVETVEVTVVATVFDEDGNQLEGADVTFDADVGSLLSGGEPVQTGADPDRARGVAVDTLTLTAFDVAGVLEGIVVVTAETVTAGGLLLEDLAEIEVAGFAANMSLSVSPSGIEQTGGQVTLTALVRDDIGRALAGAGVNFTSDLGSLASGGGLIPTNENGQATDTLSVSAAELASTVSDLFTVTAETTGVGGGIIAQTTNVSILRLAPVALFTASNDATPGCVNCVIFRSVSDGKTPLELFWDFGDGTTFADVQESTFKTTTHDYLDDTPGLSYTVRLTVINAFGVDEQIQEITVPIPQ